MCDAWDPADDVYYAPNVPSVIVPTDSVQSHGPHDLSDRDNDWYALSVIAGCSYNLVFTFSGNGALIAHLYYWDGSYGNNEIYDGSYGYHALLEGVPARFSDGLIHTDRNGLASITINYTATATRLLLLKIGNKSWNGFSATTPSRDGYLRYSKTGCASSSGSSSDSSTGSSVTGNTGQSITGLRDISITPNVLNLFDKTSKILLTITGDPNSQADVKIYNSIGTFMGSIVVALDSGGKARFYYTADGINGKKPSVGMNVVLVQCGKFQLKKVFVVSCRDKR
jgi:hypothetical protein